MDENKELVENVTEEVVKEAEETTSEAFEKTNSLSDVKEAVKENVSKLLAKLDEVDLNEEKMKKYVSDFADSVNGLVNKAAVKVNEMKEDPKTSDFMNKAQQSYENFAGKVNDVVNKTAEKLNEADLKGTVDKTVEKAKEVGTELSDRYQKFVHDPKVQSTVSNTVNAAKGLTSKAFGALKKLVKKVEKEKEE